MSEQVIRSFFFYTQERSIVHRLHPSVKILVMLLVSTGTAIIQQTAGFRFDREYLLFIGLGIALLVLARVTLRDLSRFALPVGISIFGISWMYLFIYGRWDNPPAKALLSVFGFPIIFEKGINGFLGMSSLFLGMVFPVIFLLATTRDRELVQGLRKFGLPFSASFMMCLALRSITLTLDDFFTIKQAMMSRGDNFKGGIYSRIRRYYLMSVPLVVSALRRIEEIDYAIEARGFTLSSAGRTYFEPFNFKRSDYLIIAICLVLFALFVIHRVYPIAFALLPRVFWG